MKAVILAGGFGKRLKSVTDNMPKPMTCVCGKPVLEHQVEALKKEGINEFIFVVGYLSEMITDYFKDGSRFGVSISYYKEEEPLGTGGALFKLGLKEDFLLCNGDLIFDFSLKETVQFHKNNNALATLLTHPNNHPYDSTLLLVSSENRVRAILPSDKKPYAYANLCNAGIQIVSPELLNLYNFSGKADFDKDIINPAIKTGRIFSYKTWEYVKDMGTPERLNRVETDVRKGLVKNKHRGNMQKAVFLDRDGTVNVQKGYITKPEEMELIPGAAQAISRFNQAGYLTIVVTNQPVVARGECSFETLGEIHNRMETLLGEKGAYIDGIYFCPHHTDNGFANEVKELKINCRCRKPAPGMLLKAREDFNIDMAKSFMVGDSLRDVEAGINAGCKSVYLGNTGEIPLPKNVDVCDSLLSFSDTVAD
ncbi:MAG: D-glycero-beta-D-manno-heptose 1,7-bisphosphate 7-phosphatase [Acutalibacteraceae bacterium]